MGMNKQVLGEVKLAARAVTTVTVTDPDGVRPESQGAIRTNSAV